MGKAARVRNARLAIEEKKKEQQALVLARQRRGRIVNIALSITALVLVAALVLGLFLYNSAVENGTFLRRKSALKSEHYSISAATYTYFFNYQYQSFINANSSRLSSYGLDVETPLRDQTQNNGESWFQYFAEQTTKNLTELLYLSELAHADGITLGETYQRQLDIFFENLEETAKNMDLSLEEYIYAAYGQGVHADDIKKGLEISMLATEYYNRKIDATAYSEEEIEGYYNENKNDFCKVDYKYYTFYPNTSTSMTDDQKAEALKAADGKAARLAAAKTPAQFDSILAAILKEDGKTSEEIEQALSGTAAADTAYDESFEISKWAFGEQAALYGTRTYNNGSYAAAYMITALPHRDESETRSVRHILVAPSDTLPDADAKARAEDVLKKLEAANFSTDAFSELALKYSDDPGSAQGGGLYENFTRDAMVTEFSDWCFDSARKSGDSGIVKTEHGYHVMYFVGEGLIKWKTDVVTTLKDNAYNNIYKKAQDTYKIETDDSALEKVPEIRIRASSSAS